MIFLACVALPWLCLLLWFERRPRRNRWLAAVRVIILWSLAVAGCFFAFTGHPQRPTLSTILASASFWLIPSAVWVYATVRSRWLGFRASMHAIANTSVLLIAFPCAVFSVFGGSWRILFAQSNWKISLWLHLIFLPAMVGLSAIQEFFLRGGGTPDPCDGPRRLVRSGIYSYIANPMEVAAVSLIAAIGIVLHSVAFVAIAAATAVYFLLGSDRSEQKDLVARFGEACDSYRAAVLPWRLRWRSFAQGTATLYVAQSCGMCSEVGSWFSRRKMIGLRLAAAEEHPSRDLARITYDPGDGSRAEYGVAALGRALEHVNLAWTFCGLIIRLPMLRPLIQMLVDASGAEARLVSRNPGASHCVPASFVIKPT